MDIASIGFLLLIIFVGAFIAYTADKMGRNIGKKRLSIFGLRPKNTATFLTVTAGIIIPTITVIFLVTISKDVRLWITEGRNALYEKQQREAELQVAIEKVNIKNTEIKKLEDKQNLIEKKMHDVEELLGKYSTDNKQLLSVREKLKHEKKILEDTIRSKELMLNEMKKNVDPLLKKVELLHDQKEVLEKEYLSLKKQNQDTEQEIRTKSDELKNLVRVVKDEQKKSDELSKMNAKLLEGFDSNLYATRFQPITYASNAEVASITVYPGESVNSAKNHIKLLLNLASQKALERGALGDGKSPAAMIATIFSESENKTITVEDHVNWMAKRVSKINTEMKLSARAFWNCYRGEKTPVVLSLTKK